MSIFPEQSQISPPKLKQNKTMHGPELIKELKSFSENFLILPVTLQFIKHK